MNKKTQIIVSLTGIFIVLFILIGFTYGYYLTNITGNSSATSISIETGIPGVEYTDLTGNELDNIIIEPGTTLTKRFKVTNTGNTSAKYSIYLVDVFNNFVRTEDVTYKLYRIGNTESFPKNYTGCITNPTDEMSCKLVVDTTEFPTEISVVKPDEVITTPGTYYTYHMVITYINHPSINQDADQGHTFSGKINLRPTDKEENPFSEGTLANAILTSARDAKEENSTTRTVFYDKTETLPTTPGQQSSGDNERVLGMIEDNYTETTGNYSYFFRGAVKDNYVNFAGMCWRIVRIDGKGNTKLILEDQDDECKESDGNWNIPASDGESITMNSAKEPEYLGTYGFERNNGELIANYLNPGEENADIAMVNAFKYFQTILNTNISNKYLNKTTSDYLISGNWCLENKFNINLTLKCNGTIMNTYNDETPMYVATLTVDEIIYAGVVEEDINEYFYLVNDYSVENRPTFWTLTLSGRSSGHILFGDGEHFVDGISLGGYGFRPAVTLDLGVELAADSGNGTKTSPYVIG